MLYFSSLDWYCLPGLLSYYVSMSCRRQMSHEGPPQDLSQLTPSVETRKVRGSLNTMKVTQASSLDRQVS